MPVNLDHAFALQAGGRLQEAESACRTALTQTPSDDRALHFLGILAYQQGRLQQAIGWVTQAVAASPEKASYQSDLGELHRLANAPDEAARCCRACLAIQPVYPEAWNNLGLALQALGALEDAEEAFYTALEQAPQFALAWNNLANLLRESGRTGEAIAAFRQALVVEPNLVQAHLNLGQLLLEQQQRDLLAEALGHCRRAVELAPDLAEGYNNLGNVLRAQDQLAEAVACYQKALQLSPGLAMARNNLGQAMQEQGQLDEAEAWYRAAMEGEPNNGRFLSNWASVSADRERFHEALERYRYAVKCDPACTQAHVGLGTMLRRLERWDEAKACLKEALRLEPAAVDAHCELALLHTHFGRLEKAEAAYHMALHHRPQSAVALSGLALLRRGKLPEANRQAIERLLGDPTLSDQKKSPLHFALAAVLDSRKHYREAATHLVSANRFHLVADQRRARGYDPDAHSKFVDRIAESYTAEHFARVDGWGAVTRRPIFILGMPRSGTTLTEQILASHPDIYGAGELPLIGRALDGLLDCLPQLTEPVIREESHDILRELACLDTEHARITDKMPDNYLHLGFIATLFPRATIIHCRRDLRDVAVSCWLTSFQSIRWASDQEHVARRIRDYHRLMAHWRRVLPGRMVEVDYETTVTDLEGTARRLVEAVGLPWDPACLAFHQNQRPIRTASVTQVRQPIYTRSVGRWRHYREALADVFQAVEELLPPATESESVRRVA